MSDLAGQENRPEVRFAKGIKKKKKGGYSEKVPPGEDGSQAVAAGQRKAASGGQGGAWLIHGRCVCVCVQGTGRMTDWQGLRRARLHQHRRLLRCVHSPFTHHRRPDQSCPIDCLSGGGCFSLSLSRLWVCCFEIRATNHVICQAQ